METLNKNKFWYIKISNQAIKVFKSPSTFRKVFITRLT